MRKLMLLGAVMALCLGTAAAAQSDPARDRGATGVEVLQADQSNEHFVLYLCINVV